MPSQIQGDARRTGVREQSIRLRSRRGAQSWPQDGFSARGTELASIVLLTRQIFEQAIQGFALPLVPLQLVCKVYHAREADHLRCVRLEIVLIADGPTLARARIQLAYALPLGQAPAISREAK